MCAIDGGEGFFGRADVVEAEGFGLRQRQVAIDGDRVVRREALALRMEFMQEAPEVVVVAVGKQAAALEKAGRGEPGLRACLLQRLGLWLGAIGRVEQFTAQGGDFRRAFEARQLRRPGRDLLLDALLLLGARERES